MVPEKEKVMKFKLPSREADKDSYKEWREKRKKEKQKRKDKNSEESEDRLKLKIKDTDVSDSQKSSAPNDLAYVKKQLQEMNTKQKKIKKLEELYDEEKDKRISAESKLEALKNEFEEAKSELKKLRDIEKEHEKLKREFEKLKDEKRELKSKYAREDLKNLKDAVWAADGKLKILENENKEGKISDREYQIKKKAILEEKWEAQHKILILKDWIEKAMEKTEMIEQTKEKLVEGKELRKKALERENPTPLMKEYEKETGKNAKWGSELTKGYKKWRKKRREEKSDEKNKNRSIKTSR